MNTDAWKFCLSFPLLTRVLCVGGWFGGVLNAEACNVFVKNEGFCVVFFSLTICWLHTHGFSPTIQLNETYHLEIFGLFWELWYYYYYYIIAIVVRKKREEKWGKTLVVSFYLSCGVLMFVGGFFCCGCGGGGGGGGYKGKRGSFVEVLWLLYDAQIPPPNHLIYLIQKWHTHIIEILFFILRYLLLPLL